ncbi:MAG: BatA domain-containing protein [Planctomycetes bacterium]|nr:BatA domain-containing protein [Planctomycetota bacterium]MCB9901891.1 BatA domain-containing protein [Planctomycetota bacterium]
MSFAAPMALFGLLALPVIWWLHRRTRAPRPVTVASLLFFADLPTGAASRRARRFDPVLGLLLLGAGAAALAAAGPEVKGSAGRPTARVVVEGGLLGRVQGYDTAVERALAKIRAELPDDVEVDVVRVESAQESTAYLETLARLELATSRHVVARELPTAPGPGVRWWPLDLESTWTLPPGPANVGIAAVGVEATDAGGLRVQVTLQASAQGEGVVEIPVRLVGVDARPSVEGRVSIGPGGAAGLVLDLTSEQVMGLDPHARAGRSLRVAIEREDVLRADDAVVLASGADAAMLQLDPTLDGEVADALRAAAEAGGRARPGDASRLPRIDVLRLGAAVPALGSVRTLLVPAPSGDRGVAVPARAVPVRSSSPIVRDLDVEAGSVRLSAPALEAGREGTVLLGWRDGDRTWPLLVELPEAILLTASPLDGRPALRTTPFLPLLLDNLVDDLVGPDIGAGWRAHYLRSPSLTLLRRSHGGPRGVATAGDVRTRAPAHRLRQPLLALAALALLAAWLLPALVRLTGRAHGVALARR